MSFIDTLLKERMLPSVLSNGHGGKIKTLPAFETKRKRIIKLLEANVYGTVPPVPEHMRVEKKDIDLGFAAGKAKKISLFLHFELYGKSFSFPAVSIIPTHSDGPHPAFVAMGFYDCIPNEHLPAEEIIDRGYAIFYFNANHVAESLSDSFKEACAPYLIGSRYSKSAPGKLAMWAWGAMRLMDYALSENEVDKERIAVIGHGMLGTAALIAGAFDHRFNFTVANGSGTLGASLTRGSAGMSVQEICERYPSLFCKSFTESTALGKQLPFDQNFLLSLVAPRHLMVGSATEDLWSDFTSEFLALCSLDEVYRLYGKKGLIHNDTLPCANTRLDGGRIGYHLRSGFRYLSREDWKAYMDYIDKQGKLTP